MCSSAKIASGAAFAVASPLTVEQFMERGAAFGLQMRQQEEPGSAHQWDNTAAILYSMVSTYTNKFPVLCLVLTFIY